MADSEELRVCYEGIVKHNPSNVEAVCYLALWHVERHSFLQAVKYFQHLTTILPSDPHIWLCLCVCSALMEDFESATTALQKSAFLLPTNQENEEEEDVRLKFCRGLISEKQKNSTQAMTIYLDLIERCKFTIKELFHQQEQYLVQLLELYSTTSQDPEVELARQTLKESISQIHDWKQYWKEMKGEVILRIATFKRESGNLDESLLLCESLLHEKESSLTIPSKEQLSDLHKLPSLSYSESLHLNIHCLKGQIHEIRGEYDLAEFHYKKALFLQCEEEKKRDQEMLLLLKDKGKDNVESDSSTTKQKESLSEPILSPSISSGESPSPSTVQSRTIFTLTHSPTQTIALERLGRLYLRFRETIPAAVQSLFRCIQLNPTLPIPWYLLGRCYSASGQYEDAFEAYKKSLNLEPNDPQVWCSLGVLYYAFGQYREALGMMARALKLCPTLCDAWYNVGALYDMSEQPEDAQQAYAKARENGLDERFARMGMSGLVSTGGKEFGVSGHGLNPLYPPLPNPSILREPVPPHTYHASQLSSSSSFQTYASSSSSSEVSEHQHSSPNYHQQQPISFPMQQLPMQNQQFETQSPSINQSIRSFSSSDNFLNSSQSTQPQIEFMTEDSQEDLLESKRLRTRASETHNEETQEEKKDAR